MPNPPTFSEARRHRQGLLSVAGLGAALLAVLLIGWGCGDGDAQAEVDFNRDIRPILNERCILCHGGVRRKGGLSLSFRSEAIDTTESGKRAIVPGDPGASEMMRRITLHDPDERMPQEDDPLSPEDVKKLRRWIAEGALWDDHWAYVEPVAQDLPAVSDPSWPINGIDDFILARLDREGLTPSPRADCPTLLRRVSLDLVGLPPTLAEVETTCSDPAPDAYARFVDRLLASPPYGERWAAMWLDLARYADSQGYEKDSYRSIWRYRDWVIDAFNRDLPFDRFTIEQLAGDLLPHPTEEQRIATAFHRNTMTYAEGGTDDEEHRVAAVIDRVNTTWEVWQGTSFGCVQCHSHPYDPFRQEEYYSFFAFFNHTADWDQDHERPTLSMFPEDQQDAGRALLNEIQEIEQQMIAAVSTPAMVEARRDWEGRLDDPAVVGKVNGTWQNEVLRIVRTPETERDDAQRAFIRFVFAETNPDLDSLRKQRRATREKVRALKPITTPVMQEAPEGKRRKTYVFERGNFLVRGEEVHPGVPGAMPPMPEDAPKNRLGMAQWLVSPENPLTARVMVNRFWEQLFGTGIVETLEDFGTQGLPPSHAALLDWLALQFVHEHQWSVKQLLKQIVTSATYRQTSRVTPVLLERDLQNRLLARGPRVRLSAEQLRDQALAVSGLLSTKMHGPSVMPSQPPGIWRSPYSGAQWETSDGEDRHRRGIYTYWRRTSPYPSMVIFDSPSREFCVSRRIRTNTPLQALITLNDPVYVEAARALARRMIEHGGEALDDRLRTGYALALAHDPEPAKLAVLRDFYEQAASYYRENPDDGAALAAMDDLVGEEMAALTAVANVILNLDEFITKE